VFLALLAGAVSAADFSADLDVIEPREKLTVKLHVKGDVYRVEAEAEGKRRIVIVDKTADTATMIDPQAKTYKIIKGHRIAFVCPIYAMEMTKGRLTKAEVGDETVDGRSCKHLKYTHPNMKDYVVDVWHATDLDHFVRVKSDRLELALRNIKVGPVPVALMKVPLGLEREKTPEEIEAALPSLSGTADAQAPVGRRLSGGGELRVKVDPNRRVMVSVESRTKGETVANVIPCFGGRPRENIGTTAWMLKGIGLRRDRKFNENLKTFAKTFQVDEVRIKVDKGLGRVKVEQSGEDGQDRYLFGGQSTWGTESEKLTITITGDFQAGPTSTGTLVVTTKEGNQTEEFTLENGKSKTWTYEEVKGFSIKVGLGKGGLKVRTQ
jgi:hypothetical protein